MVWYTSRKKWYEKFSDYLSDMNVVPSRSESDIWMRLNPIHNIYEYIAVYIDNFAIAA